MRRATYQERPWLYGAYGISIHALHEESDRHLRHTGARRDISIHALHEESDPRTKHDTPKQAISIHALHEESDRIP